MGGSGRKARDVHLSGYRIMWMMVMFDLPVDTKANMRAATKFRESLLDLGFERCQFSVYARFCNGREHFDTLAKKVAAELPYYGEVQILHFTDKQYESILSFSGKTKKKAQQKPGQLALF